MSEIVNEENTENDDGVEQDLILGISGGGIYGAIVG